ADFLVDASAKILKLSLTLSKDCVRLLDVCLDLAAFENRKAQRECGCVSGMGARRSAADRAIVAVKVQRRSALQVRAGASGFGGMYQSRRLSKVVTILISVRQRFFQSHRRNLWIRHAIRKFELLAGRKPDRASQREL